MLSDLGKHDDTRAASEGVLAQLGMMLLVTHASREDIVRYIQGFN